jgi:hypothetical protein
VRFSPVPTSQDAETPSHSGFDLYFYYITDGVWVVVNLIFQKVIGTGTYNKKSIILYRQSINQYDYNEDLNFKLKINVIHEILLTSDLSKKTISRPPQSCETIPFLEFLNSTAILDPQGKIRNRSICFSTLWVGFKGVKGIYHWSTV